MDGDAAFRHLNEYCELVKQAQEQPMLSRERRATAKAISEHLPGVNYYLRVIGPDMKLIGAYSVNDHVRALPRVRRAMSLLTDALDMTSHQWTGGGPALPLAVLDPLVSGPAAPLWAAGKYRQAVVDAASNVNHFTQSRLGRHDVSDSDLMTQAFSEKPPEEGKPRLRCPGDHDSMVVRSIQHGAMLMSQGAFQAIRNPAVHMTGDWNPVTAAEQLAALGIVARWVRHWDVDRYVPPPDPSARSNLAVAEAMAILLTQKPAQPGLPELAD